jgi:hypothetical protein
MSHTTKQFEILKAKRSEVKQLREEVNDIQLKALEAIGEDFGLTEIIIEKFDPASDNALFDTLVINDDITARFDRFGTLTIYSKSAATKNSNFRGKVISKISLDTPEKVQEVLVSLSEK